MNLPGSSSPNNFDWSQAANSSSDSQQLPTTLNGPKLVGEIKEEPLDFEVIRVSGVHNESQAQPLLDSNLLNHVEVKEEADIKTEEVDDFQPGEPIADIFLPCSGASRPIGQVGPSNDDVKEEVFDVDDESIKEEVEEMEESTSRETSARPKVQRKKRKAKFSYPAKGASDYYKKKKLLQQQQEDALQNDVDELNDVYSGSSFAHDGMNDFKEEGEAVDETSLSTRPCYFCGVITTEFYSTSMLTTRQRNAFLNSILAKTAIDRDQLPGVSDVIDRHFFCREHFPSHSVKRNELNLLNVNLPIYQKPKSAYTKRDKPEPIISNTYQKPSYTKCELCAVPMPPFRSSPEDPIERMEFSWSIVKMNTAQREKFEWIRDNVGYFTSVCSKHFEEEQEDLYDDEPSTSAASIGPFEAELINKQKKKGTVKRQFYPPKGYHAKKLAEKKARQDRQRGISRPKMVVTRPAAAGESFAVEYVIDKKAAEATESTGRKCRKCDLCGGQAANYVTSPIYSMFAKKFFDNLIWVTAHHKERIAWFLRIGKRATVCARHLRQRATTVTNAPAHVVRQLCSTAPLPAGMPELPKEEEMDAPPGDVAHNYELREEKPPKRIFTL